MIKVLIVYDQKKTYFECDKNVTVRSVLKKYASIKNLDYEHIYGLNNGENIALNKFKRLKLNVKLKKDEIKRGLMEIQAEYNYFERTPSNVTTNSILEEADEKDYDKINEITDINIINKINIDKDKENYENNNNNEEEENDDDFELINNIDHIIDINNDEEKNEILIPNETVINLKDKSYKNPISLYLLLLIEFILTFIFALLGFILGLNDKINNNKKLKLALFILTTIILSGISISINFIPSKYLKRKPSFIFSIVYIFCITIISFLFSDYINSKAILSSLGLIIFDAISMEIYALIIYCYKPNNEQKQFSFNIYGYLLSPFISNILVIIILHFCLIKNGFDTLYLSIAGLFFILSHFILMHLLNKFYKKKRIYFS